MDNNTPKPATLEAGHEISDVQPLGVWLTAFGLLVCCVLLMATVMGMFHFMQRSHDKMGSIEATQTVEPAITKSAQAFPAPLLQVAPEIDVAALRAREDTQLNYYGWIDRKAGVVRIPVSRAMDLIARRGLSTRGESDAPLPTRTVLDMQQARPSDWAKQQQAK